jgi:hypothetical protein
MFKAEKSNGESASKPLTLSHLIKFLETKDPNEKYHFGSTTNCMNAQYLKWAFNCPNVSVGHKTYVLSDKNGARINSGQLPTIFDQVGFRGVADMHASNPIGSFGRALAYARKKLKDE